MCSNSRRLAPIVVRFERFQPIIELAQEALAKLVEHLAELVAFPGRRVFIEKLGDFIQGIEVFEHGLANARPLHFDRDLPAIAQACAMHLAERGSRHRRDLEVRKGFRHSDAELRRHDLFDLVEREWLDLVLQSGERFEVRARHQLDAGGKELPKFDEGRAQLLQVVRQFAGLGRFLGGDPLFGRERLFESGFLDQVGSAVFNEEPRDLPVAIEVLRFQRNGHASLKRIWRACGLQPRCHCSSGFSRKEALVPAKAGTICERLRRFLVARLVVDLEPIEERCRGGIKAMRLDLLLEPFAFLRIIVRICRFDFVAPGVHFLRRFLFPMAIEPFRHLVVAGAFLDLRLEIVTLHPFETEKHVIERTIKMILADVARDQRAAFVERPAQNRVAADANSRTPGRFLGQILSSHFGVHEGS